MPCLFVLAHACKTNLNEHCGQLDYAFEKETTVR